MILAVGCSGESPPSAAGIDNTGPQGSTATLPPGHPDIGCQALSFGGKNYFYCKTDRKFATARQKCLAVGMDLVAIETAEEDAWLTGAIDEHVWLGSTDASSPGVWSWLFSGETFWDDGPVAGRYENFEGDDPDFLLDGDCAAKDPPIGGGKWETFHCSLEQAYVCEAPPAPTEQGCGQPPPPDKELVTVTVFATSDTYVETATPNKPHATETTLQVATGLTRKSALVRFSEAALGEALTGDLEDARLVSANLVLPVTSTLVGADVGAHSLLHDWKDTGATWNCSEDTNPSNSTRDCAVENRWDLLGGAGAHFAANATDTESVSLLTTQISLDVTADVAKVFEEEQPNYGWLLRSSDLVSGVNFQANTNGSRGPRLVLAMEVERPKPAWERVRHGLACMPAGNTRSLIAYTVFLTHRIACAVARGEPDSEYTRMFKELLVEIEPAELPAVLARASEVCDELDSMPAAVRAELLGPLAASDPWALPGPPDRSDVAGLSSGLLSSGRRPRLRTNFCDEGLASDPSSVTVGLELQPASPDNPPGFGPARAFPVVVGVRPISLNNDRQGEYVGHASLVDDWAANRSKVTPDNSRTIGDGLALTGVPTGVACAGIPDVCDSAQGLACNGVECVAHPVVFISDPLTLVGYNVWDVEESTLVLERVDLPSRPVILPVSSVFNMENALGSLNCTAPADGQQLRDLDDLNKQLVQFNLQGVAAGQYRVKLFNHNGTFRTQHDERDAPGRVVHVCPAECTATNLGGCPVCTDPGQSGCFFGTCAAPVAATCMDDAEGPAGACTLGSGSWTVPPRPLSSCSHSVEEPPPCQETPEWFGSAVDFGTIFVRNHPAMFEISTTLHSIKCNEESGRDCCGASDELRLGLTMVNPHMSALPGDSFLAPHRIAQGRYENDDFDDDERRTPNKPMGAVRLRADQSLVFFETLREDDAGLRGWNIFYSALAAAGAAFVGGVVGDQIGGTYGAGIGAGIGAVVAAPTVYLILEPNTRADHLGDALWLGTPLEMLQRIQASRQQDFLVPGGTATGVGPLPSADDTQVIIGGQPVTWNSAGTTEAFLMHPLDLRGSYLDSPARCECGNGCAGQSCDASEGACFADRCNATFGPDCLVSGSPSCWRESRKTRRGSAGDPSSQYHVHYFFDLRACDPAAGTCTLAP
jgi:hypothetical protein